MIFRHLINIDYFKIAVQLKLAALILFLVMNVLQSGRACHKFSLTYGRMFVSQNTINLELKVPLEDLILFHYLDVDSNRSYSVDEIQNAGEHYIEELQRAFHLTVNMVKVNTEKIRLQPFRLISGEQEYRNTIPLSLFNKLRLTYIINYSLPVEEGELRVQQNFGSEYPLIPSLMVLDVDGISDQRISYRLTKGSVQIIGRDLPHEHVKNQIVLSTVELGQNLSFQFHLPDLLLLLSLTNFDNFKLSNLSSLFEIKIDGQKVKQQVEQLRFVEEGAGLAFELLVDYQSKQFISIHWLKFNRGVAKFPFIREDVVPSETEFISRFNDVIQWSGE